MQKKFISTFQHGDNTTSSSEVSLQIIGNKVTGQDVADYSTWTISGEVAKDGKIFGIYWNSDQEPRGTFLMVPSANGYHGQYTGILDDGSVFTGEYNWEIAE